MRFRPEVKVGVIVFLGPLTLVIIYWFFGGLGLRAGTYQICAIFDDVMRLSRGTDVRMAGVRIGTVQDISLTSDKRAQVVMLINSRFENAIPKDSTARVTTGGLVGVGEYYVEIIPGASKTPIRRNEYLNTAKMPNLDDVLADVNQIITGLRTTVDSINAVIADPKMQQSLKNIIANADTTTEQIAALTMDVRTLVAENKSEIAKIITNVDKASSDFAVISRDVRQIVGRGRPDIDRTLDNVRAASEDFAVFSKELRRVLEGSGANDIASFIASAKTTADNLSAVSQQLRAITDDESLTGRIRETIENAAKAAKGAAEIVERVRGIVGVGKASSEALRTMPITDKGSQLNVFAGGEDKTLRLDYNFGLMGKGDRFYKLGLFDFGHKPKINVQIGEAINAENAYRYGVYASRLGIGYDRLFSDNLRLNLDLYHPSAPKLEAKLRYDINPNLGLWAGSDNLFGGEGIVGLQFRK